MKLLKVDTLQEAREKLLKAVSEKPLDTERVRFASSLGRVLAADIRAVESIPPFRRSTVRQILRVLRRASLFFSMS